MKRKKRLTDRGRSPGERKNICMETKRNNICMETRRTMVTGGA
jgi:hypothetical protein